MKSIRRVEFAAIAFVLVLAGFGCYAKPTRVLEDSLSYPGAQNIGSPFGAEDSYGMGAILTTRDDRAKVMTWYETQLKADGWKQAGTNEVSAGTELRSFEKAGKRLTVSIGESTNEQGMSTQIILIEAPNR